MGLIERIREIEADGTSEEDLNRAATPPEPLPQDRTVKAILAYLNQRGYVCGPCDKFRAANCSLTLSGDV